MSLRLRRGPSTDRISLVFQAGELVYDTTEKRLYVGDDLTQGGVPVSDLLSDLSPQLGANLDLNGEDIIGFGNINIDGDITATGTLTIPAIVTDVTGSIFGDDSTPLVDGANSMLVLDNNALSDLGDVIAPDQDEQFLQWDSSTNTWRPKTFNLTDHVFNSTENTYLRFNGNGWVASNIIDNINSKNGRILVNAETEVLYLEENSLADIGDVYLPVAPDDGSILKYNSTTGFWEADSSGIAVNLNDLSDVNSGVVPILGDTLIWNGLEWAFEQPKQTTNVVGSVFGDDSTILVDGILNKINLSNNSLSDLDDVEPYVYNNINIGSILKWNGFRWQIADPAQLDTFTGSVFGDDSSLIIDGIDHSITTSLIKLNNENRLTIQALPNAEYPKIDLESYGIGNYHVTRNSDTIVDPAGELFIGQYGSYINDPNGLQLKSLILTTEKSIFLFGGAADLQTGLHPESYVLTIKEGKFGFGTFNPVETLHTEGSISATEYVKFGSYTTTERDNLTTTNNPQHALDYGMVIYNTTTNTFQGWANVGGTTPTWVDLS